MIAVEGYGECVLIGRGGVGEVYRSTRLSTGASVAIKVLHQVSDESAAWRRTRRELAAMVALAGHAHVIGVMEVLDLPGGPALVMEYAPGGSVGDLLANGSARLAVGEAVLIAEHAARALVAAHARGIVHRDIKPHNLLIDGYGQVKLCDFGIASLARSEEFRNQTNAVSLRYASPEDLEGDLDAGPSTDIYSLGATLLHLVHGAPPSLRERLVGWQPPSRVAPHDLPAAETVNGSVDDAVNDAVNEVIVACVRIDPAQRPAASEVLLMLEHLPLSNVDRPRSIAGSPSMSTVDQPKNPPNDRQNDPLNLSPIARQNDRRNTPLNLSPIGRQNDPPMVADFDEVPDRTIVRPSSASPPVAVLVPEDIGWSIGRLWQRRLLVALRLIASLLLAAVFLLPRVIGGDGSNSAVDVGVVSRPTDLVELTLLEWPLGAVGECLVQTADGIALDTVGCAAPHDLQRIAVGEFASGSGEPVADDATLMSAVRNICMGQWDLLVMDHGIVLPSVVNQAMQLSNVRPTADAVAAGDTTYQCFVGVPGQRLTGNILGTGQ